MVDVISRDESVTKAHMEGDVSTPLFSFIVQSVEEAEEDHTLTLALEEGYLDNVSAEVNVVVSLHGFRTTCLLYALEEEYINTALWLLKHNADPHLEVSVPLGENEWTNKNPLQVAVANGQIGTVEAMTTSPLYSEPTPKQVLAFLDYSFIEASAFVRLLNVFPYLSSLPKTDESLANLWFGEGSAASFTCSQDDFLKYAVDRNFGHANPDACGEGNPWIRLMLRKMCCAYSGRSMFPGVTTLSILPGPVWCYARFGVSVCSIPDGRYVLIGGEHEDSYDPDFQIYNDVILVNPSTRSYEMFCYPRDVFPPTDFHSATLISEAKSVYIIGNLGYMTDRRPGKTPVYRLDLTTMIIEEVATTAVSGQDNPGWIGRHVAWYDCASKMILLTGGSVWTTENTLIDNERTFSLSLTSLQWSVV